MILKSNGFSTISFLIFLPVLMILTSIYVVIQLTTQHIDQFNSNCLNDLRPVQKTITRATDQILSLNPYSTALRQQIMTVSLALSAAISSQNYPLAAELTLKLQQLKIKQRQLDLLQRQLLTKGKFDLFNLQKDIQNKFSFQNKSKIYTKNNLTDYSKSTTIGKFATFNLVPDSIAGIAPNYRLPESYIHQHTVVLSWQFETHKNTYRRQCSLSSKKDGHNWQLIIKKDKF